MAEPALPANGAPRELAALDLGSNSFHLIVAQESGGHLQTLDKIREMVRLAEGLDDRQRLTEAASQRALECLERFGQRLRHLRRENVRVVGTNALRKAHDSEAFIESAEQALG
ncbi:MAG: exopolyphosphatase, partial [Gammaproteobacteria bacterium]|nr:exopolyphosphatase [Gammaproteobacteria bacterium]